MFRVSVEEHLHINGFDAIVSNFTAIYRFSLFCSRLLAYDPARLQFPAEIRWVEQDVDAVYILSTRFQKFFRRTVNPNEVNLRIVRIPLGTRLSHGFGNNIFFK